VTFENIFRSTLTGFIFLKLVKLGLKHLAGAIQCTKAVITVNSWLILMSHNLWLISDQRLGTLSKRSHWTIRTAILFHQNISRKVWSIIAAAASLWWSVRHTKINKWPKVFKFSKCSSAPSCELINWLDSKLIPKLFEIFEFLKKIFLNFFLKIFLGHLDMVHPRYLSRPESPGQLGVVCP